MIINRNIVVKILKTPPRYGIDMSRMARQVMQYAILIHVVISYFIFTNSAIFIDDTSDLDIS